MERRTVELIRFMKHHGHEYPNLREAAIHFMADYTGTRPLEVYEHGVIEKLVLEHFYDFIDAVDKPSMVLRQMNESRELRQLMPGQPVLSEIAAQLIAMIMIQVRNDTGYINGFKSSDFDEQE